MSSITNPITLTGFCQLAQQLSPNDAQAFARFKQQLTYLSINATVNTTKPALQHIKTMVRLIETGTDEGWKTYLPKIQARAQELLKMGSSHPTYGSQTARTAAAPAKPSYLLSPRADVVQVINSKANAQQAANERLHYACGYVCNPFRTPTVEEMLEGSMRCIPKAEANAVVFNTHILVTAAQTQLDEREENVAELLKHKSNPNFPTLPYGEPVAYKLLKEDKEKPLTSRIVLGLIENGAKINDSKYSLIEVVFLRSRVRYLSMMTYYGGVLSDDVLNLSDSVQAKKIYNQARRARERVIKDTLMTPFVNHLRMALTGVPNTVLNIIASYGLSLSSQQNNMIGRACLEIDAQRRVSGSPRTKIPAMVWTH